MLRNVKFLFVILAVLVIAGSAYAFAATNTVPDSAAGYKANMVNGYEVTSIVYDLDAADPTLVDAITFDIEPIADTVVAAIVKLQTVTGGTWTDCTLGTATLLVRPVTCTYGTLNLIEVTALNVVASSSADPAP